VLFTAVAQAAFSLAERNIGALMVIVKNDRIDELVKGGVSVRADVTAALLDAIFQKSSMLHDGAVIVDHGTVTLANVVLPLTHQMDVPFEFGTRHRAAMGLAERCDARVVVVSEQRGKVTVTRGREFIEASTPGQLVALLETPATVTVAPSRALRSITANWRYKLAALGVASLVFAGVRFSPGNMVRTVNIPIEFTNLPNGYDLKQQSVITMEAQLRGRTWIMDSTDLSHLVARFDLQDVGEGTQQLRIQAAKLDLPPAIEVGQVRPQTVSIVVVKQPDQEEKKR
jgi:hypothetical protein